VCEYCGCRQLEPIAELMDEHATLLELAGDLRRALVEEDVARALRRRDEVVELLAAHTGREEAGIFAALKDQGDFVEQVDELESEHVALDDEVALLDPTAPGAIDVLDRLVADLRDHIDKEDNGIFPVAVVTLGATGWETVERARQAAGEPAAI